jgi:hypothetical protein
MTQNTTETNTIAQMTLNGKTRIEIGAALGMSISGVRYRQDRLGLRPAVDRPRPHRLAVEWTPEVQALWDGPMNKKQIAAVLGVGRTALASAAIRVGAPPRLKNVRPVAVAPVDPMAGLTESQIADVNTLRKSRYTIKDAIAMVTATKVKVSLFAPSKNAVRA